MAKRTHDDAPLRIERKKITDLIPDPTNANKGTERGLRALDDSMAEVGLGRSVLVDKNGYLIAGNKTTERAVDRGFEDAIIVHTDGKQLVVVQRDDLDLMSHEDTKARKLAYYDNRVGQLDLEWDAEQVLADLQGGVDLSNLFDVENLLDVLNEAAEAAGEGDIADAGDAEAVPLTRWDVPDAIFATDNDYEIPLLDINLQARSFDLPFAVWGALSRQSKVTGGTYAFYIDDYRFEALWRDPSGIVNSGCRNIVEPNFSVFETMPLAIAAYQTYRKRWIARWCQVHGVRVFVDLNVVPKWRELNLLGVPRGWQAYCTRGATEYADELAEEFALACEHAESDTPLFVVYGGGQAVHEQCKERGWLWLNNQQRRRHGLYEEMSDGI